MSIYQSGLEWDRVFCPISNYLLDWFIPKLEIVYGLQWKLWQISLIQTEKIVKLWADRNTILFETLKF